MRRIDKVELESPSGIFLHFTLADLFPHISVPYVCALPELKKPYWIELNLTTGWKYLQMCTLNKDLSLPQSKEGTFTKMDLSSAAKVALRMRKDPVRPDGRGKIFIVGGAYLAIFTWWLISKSPFSCSLLPKDVLQFFWMDILLIAYLYHVSSLS